MCISMYLYMSIYIYVYICTYLQKHALTWAPRVCKVKACWARFTGLGPLCEVITAGGRVEVYVYMYVYICMYTYYYIYIYVYIYIEVYNSMPMHESLSPELPEGPSKVPLWGPLFQSVLVHIRW